MLSAIRAIIMKIQEKAEQYANQRLGAWRDIIHSGYSISECTNGEVSVQDYTAGYNEAKRWIPVGERLPEIVINGRINYVLCNNAGFPFVGQYTGVKSEFHVIGTKITKHVIEWREI